MKTYYELLQVAPDASAAQIKQAFRHTIARYHPDKVQHLGTEFQELAQVRSAELTTAYKTLIDEARRSEYDQSLHAGGPAVPASEAPREAAAPAPPEAASKAGDAEAPDLHFGSLRSDRNAVLRRAALERVDHLFHEAFAVSELWPVAGFDISYLSKPRLFDRPQTRPWLLAKFVARLDKRTVQRVRAEAARANAVKQAAVSVFLLSDDITSEHEIADAIATQKPAAEPGHRIVIIPVDVRDWHALVPKSADPAIQSLAARLRTT